MLQAVLLATVAEEKGGPAAALAWEDTTLLGRLLDQLAALGVSEAHVVTRPAWAAQLERLLHDAPVDAHVRVSADLAEDMRTLGALAAEGDGGLVVAAADVLTQQEALAGLVADPRIATGILATRRRLPRFLAFGTQSRRGLLVRAASPYHRVPEATEMFLGVLKIAPENRAAVVPVAERIAGVLEGSLPETWQRAFEDKARAWRVSLQRRAALGTDDDFDDDEPALDAADLAPEDAAELRRRLAAAREDAPALLVQGLVRASVPVGIGMLRRLFWARPLSPADVEQAAARIGEYDEDLALMQSAVKANDGFFTTFFVSPYSKYIARWAARRGWSPNAVTLLSMAVGLLAAAAFATGERAGLVAGALLLQAAFTLDCVDGQLARYTRTFSRFGAWLDSMLDRGKEYVVYAGLAIGSAHGGDDVWVLAGAALILQTVRHAADLTFNTAQDQSIGAVLSRPLMKRKVPPPWHRLRDLEHTPRGTWLRKIVALPIGERFAVISLTAALFDARVTFVVLLAWGGFAMLYSSIGRTLRSLGRRGETSLKAGTGDAPGALTAYRDDGPVALAIARALAPRFPVPPLAMAGAGAAPLGIAIAAAGAGASWTLVGGTLAWAVLAGAASGARPLRDRLRWSVPPVLCAIECAGLLWIGAITASLPAAFALIAVVAFRRYDLAYRRRFQGSAVAEWLARGSGGWDGRLIAGAVIGAAGAAAPGLWVAAAVLGGLLALELVLSWMRADPTAQPAVLIGGDE